MNAVTRGLVVGAVAALLVSCGRAPGAKDEDALLAFARAAVERNPAIELVATDESRRVFTVRDRASGRVEVVALDALVAGPPWASAAAPAVSAEVSSAATGAETVEQPEAEPPAASAVEDEATDGADAVADGGTIPPGVVVDRTGGRLAISGPGVSITSVPAAPRGDDAAGAPRLTRRDAPIVCDGARVLRLEDRTLEVDGDAIVARGGCEVYVTRSRIVATGVAVRAEGARVHLAESDVVGGTASVEASDGADVFLQGSSVRGTTRRFRGATIHDLGGNRLR
jgi:hypothetical protein